MVQSMTVITKLAIVMIATIVIGGLNAKPPNKVVGGMDANLGEFPYQVSVRKNNGHFCGGVIIGKRHVLTAGHCVDQEVSNNPAKELTVVSGSNVLLPGGGFKHAIESITIHPEYSTKAEDLYKNDIAVITLTKEIVINKWSNLASLPEEDTPENLKCSASGWGRLSFPRGRQPNNLQKIEMTTMTNEECREELNVDVLKTQLCAYHSVGVGLCSGDSGGPLVHKGVVVGITSFVLPCGKGVPDVFTRVYSHIDFIQNVMKRAH